MSNDKQKDQTPDTEDCFATTLSTLEENLLVMDQLASELRAVKTEDAD